MAQAVLLLYAVYLLCRPEAAYVYLGADLVSEHGIYMEDFLGQYGNGYYLDNGIDAAEGEALTVLTPAVDLRRGAYRVTIQYSASDGNCRYSTSSAYNTYQVVSGRQDIELNKSEQSETFTLSSPIRVEDYQLTFTYGGDGYLFVNSVSICEMREWKRVNLFVILFFSLLLDLVYIRKQYFHKELIAEEKQVIFVIALLVLLSSLPMFSYYLPVAEGHDLEFHLYRIEGIKEGLLAGQLPVRVPPSWMNGYGYATSVFYGELFLYIPAILRMIGFSVQNAYKIYIVLVNLATCLIAYWCLNRVLKDRIGSLAGCAAYVLAPYRLVCLYLRAAVGEYTAMVFLPLVFYGLYVILTADADEEGYQHKWITAVLGYTGIIQSHVISGVIAGIFTLLFCLVFIKRVIRPKRLGMLVKVVGCTVLLNLWFIVPFLDYMRFGYSGTSLKTLGRFNASGTFLTQLFELFPHGSGDSFSVAEGLGRRNEMSFSIGAGLMASCVLYLYYRISRPQKRNEVLKLGDWSLGFGALALFMTTVWFPWDFIQQINKVSALVTQNIQFPWRILGVASMFLAVVAGCLVFWLKEAEERTIYLHITGALAILFFLSSGYLLNDFTNSMAMKRYQDETSLNSCNVMQGEYLPDGTDWGIFENDSPIPGEGLILSGYEKEKGKVTIACENTSGQVNCVDVSFLNYEGYRAVDLETESELTVTAGNGGRVRVVLPAGYRGAFRVSFCEPWYWRVCEAISLLALACGVVGIAHRRKMAETKEG